MEDYTDESSSFESVDDDTLQRIFNIILYDVFHINAELLALTPKYDALFVHCYRDLQEYVYYGGGTNEKDRVRSCISLFFFGQKWPRYCDTITYRRTFFDALKALQQTYQI